MSSFPRAMNDVLILAGKIRAGIAGNPVDYPDPPFGLTLFVQLLLRIIAELTDEQEKGALFKEAGDKRRETLDDLIEEMRRIIALAKAAHPDDAAKLEEIGVEPDAAPQSLAPGQCRGLVATHQGAGTVELDWHAPERTASTGDPSAYVLTRETRDVSTHQPIEEFGTWQSIEFHTKAMLMNQPRGVEILYRVTAKNVNGSGPPIDAERVVL